MSSSFVESETEVAGHAGDSCNCCNREFVTTFSEGITDLSNAQAHEDREDRFVGVTQETQIY